MAERKTVRFETLDAVVEALKEKDAALREAEVATATLRAQRERDNSKMVILLSKRDEIAKGLRETIQTERERAEAAEARFKNAQATLRLTADAARQAHDDADAALQSLMAKYDPKVDTQQQRIDGLEQAQEIRVAALRKANKQVDAYRQALDVHRHSVSFWECIAPPCVKARDALSPLATLHGESSTASLRQRVSDRVEQPRPDCGFDHENFEPVAEPEREETPIPPAWGPFVHGFEKRPEREGAEAVERGQSKPDPDG